MEVEKVDTEIVDIKDTSKKKDNKKERIIILVLLLLLLAIVTGGYLFIKNMKTDSDGTVTIQNSDKETEEDDNPLEGLYVTYSGITDTEISKESVVKLENLAVNGDIVMKFQVYEGDDLLYESDYIKSGTSINWNAGSDLSEGEHTLRVVQIPQIEVDGEWVPLTSGTCECTLTRV